MQHPKDYEAESVDKRPRCRADTLGVIAVLATGFLLGWVTCLLV